MLERKRPAHHLRRGPGVHKRDVSVVSLHNKEEMTDQDTTEEAKGETKALRTTTRSSKIVYVQFILYATKLILLLL